MLSVYAFTLAAVALPVLLYYRRFHLAAVFYFTAGDMFYYLDVARYSRGLPFYSFDGIHPTNGFHPLWQNILYGLSHLSRFSVDTPSGLGHIFVLNIALVSTGYALLSTFLVRYVRLPALGVVALCPGFAWFLLAVANTNYLSPWAYINGMESGLTLLFFGLLLALFPEEIPSGWGALGASLLLGLAVLSRLDDVFYLIAFAGFGIALFPSHRLKTALAYVPAFAMIAAYMLYNHHTVGTFLPVSGAAKARFALAENVGQTVRSFLPSAWEAQPRALTYSMWSELAMRLYQMWLPLLVCGGFLEIARRRKVIRRYPVLACLCVGSVLKGLYNLCLVPIWNQGNWYYPVSIFASNAVLAIALDHALQKVSSKPPRVATPLQNTLRFAAAGLLVWVCFFGVVSHKAAEHFAQENADMYSHGKEIAAQIRARGSQQCLELEDGIVAFSAGVPTTSGIGLALDPEALQARNAGRFFSLMDRRGIHCIVAGGLYQDVFATVLAAGDPGILLLGLKRSELEQYVIQPQLPDPETLTTIYDIVRRRPGD